MIKKVWLGLAQFITAGVLLFFITATLKPQWIPHAFSDWVSGASRLKSRTIDPNANVLFRQAPANMAGLSYHEAVSKAIPSVVRIYAITGATNGNLMGMEKENGSGVIVDDQGYIVTNTHVVEGASQIQVVLNDDRYAVAQLIGVDPDNDLAVLKIELKNLTPITMGNEDDLRVGDVVLAIGNPFDVGQSVSMGIVSALHRTNMNMNTFENFIQTDAAINPGNSGGALINSNGHLVGINEFIMNDPRSDRPPVNAGVGFAIPVSTIEQVVPELIRTGKVSRGFIGINSQNITPEMARAFGLPDTSGVIVASVTDKGPAAMVGVQVGDILLRINDQVIKDVSAMVNTVAKLKPGEGVKLSLSRNGQVLELRATVAERPVNATSMMVKP